MSNTNIDPKYTVGTAPGQATGGGGFGPAHTHAEAARMAQQAAGVAAQQGKYGVAAMETLKAGAERLAQAASSGVDIPTRQYMPGSAEWHAANAGQPAPAAAVTETTKVYKAGI